MDDNELQEIGSCVYKLNTKSNQVVVVLVETSIYTYESQQSSTSGTKK